tara:strand:+ start:843 stop:1286 length:444 start_codon:yes stop_codon:yes gene_type:complete
MALAIAAIALSVVSAGASIKGQKDAADAQEEQNEIQSAQERINDVTAARRKVKEARVARARLLQGSEAAGTTGSSGEAGGLSSLNTQLSTNLAEQAGQAHTANAISASNVSLAKKQFVSGTVGAVAGVAQSIFTQQAIAGAAKPPVK